MDVVNFRDVARCGIGASVYRVYRMSAGGVMSTRIIHAKTDAQAKTCALALLQSKAIELWDRGRFIARFQPDGQPAAASIRLATLLPMQK